MVSIKIYMEWGRQYFERACHILTTFKVSFWKTPMLRVPLIATIAKAPMLCRVVLKGRLLRNRSCMAHLRLLIFDMMAGSLISCQTLPVTLHGWHCSSQGTGIIKNRKQVATGNEGEARNRLKTPPHF